MTWTRQPLVSLVSEPAMEPLTLAEAKGFLKVDGTADDALIVLLIAAARQWVETYTRRSFMTQTWDCLYLDFPSIGAPLVIPKAPLVSVSSITYTDENSVEQTWASTNYAVQTFAGPSAGRGLVRVTPTTSYPATLTEAETPVTVRVVCGYGATPASVPAGIRSAIALLLGDLYTQRQETIVGFSSSKTQTTLERQLGKYRLPEAT
jgi:hypothetical protein